MVALWKYDLFPYVLGGHVTHLDKDGLALIGEYDARFQPLVMLPDKEGEQALRAIKALQADYQLAHRELEAKMKERRAECLGSFIPSIVVW
jgi:hypothetical protein